MGILRSDRVSGLGGANATNGSVFFPNPYGSNYFHPYMEIVSDDFVIGAGDFTSECFFYQDGAGGHTSTGGNILVLTANRSGTNGIWLGHRNDGKFQANIHYSGGTWNLQITSTNAFNTNQWYHVALVRSGSAVKLYVDGVQEASGTSSSALTASVSNAAWIGAQGNSTNPSTVGARGINGYISNVRISNEALYTAAFTPPTTRLEKLSSTLLLCCQSPGNILKEETGKTITLYKKVTASTTLGAKRFAPDLGEEHGTTFTDNTKFDTLSYMVPPGGKTTDRYLKSTGDIVSGNLIWHIDAGNPTSYAGVTTSGVTIYDLQGGSGTLGNVGIATLKTGHSSWPAPGWTTDNGGAWYLGSDSSIADGNYTGQMIELPLISLGNDNYTINVWVKLKHYSANSDGHSYLLSNQFGSPVTTHCHIKRVSGKGRIGFGAYYTGWTYDYSSDADENTMIELNEWYMLTWVNTAQYTQSMYVNGVIQKLNGGAYTWNSRSSNSTPVNATSYAGNETTNAWIGQIQYYSDTLTADEILQNYNVHKCRYDQ